MSRYPPELRDLAHAAETATRWGAKISTVIGLGLAASHDPSGAAVVIAEAGFVELVSMAALGIANDPPRRDFELVTTVWPRRIRPENLSAPTSQEPRDTWRSFALARGIAADDAARTLTACRVAFERQQGALAAHRDGEAYARGVEAARFAEEASLALEAMADSTDALYSRWLQDPRRWVSAYYQFQSQSEPRLSVAKLPLEVLGRLYLSGLPLRRLEFLLANVPRDVAGLFREPIDEVNATRRFAERLRAWTPPLIS